MKKILLGLVALFCAAAANAQVGIIAGLTSSSSSMEEAYADIKNVNQYHVGLAYKFGIGNLITIQPALIYNMKGTSIGEIGNVQDVAVDYKTGYLELPVQLQVGFGLGPIARVFGFAEPFIGYAITNSVTGSLQGVVNKEDVVQTWDNVKTRFEYGVGLGVGAELFKHLQLSVKYFWNMGQIYGKDINLGGISSNISEHAANGVAASVAFFF